MKREIFIEVTADGAPSAECISAGYTAEHNAVALVFTVDNVFAGENYRYFLEFIMPDGGCYRTDYLPLQTPENTVSFDLPASVTGYNCVDCYFNAVLLGENGETKQVVKPKTVTLLFSPLYDANGEVLRAYDFSVNFLLEAIRNGTFRGEKGDTGAAGRDGTDYILTSADKREITADVAAQCLGLPLRKSISGVESAVVSDSAAGLIQAFTVEGQLTVSKENEDAACSVENPAEISGIQNLVVQVNETPHACTLTKPLYALEDIKDTADIVQGTRTDRVETYTFTGTENFIYASTYVYKDITVYRYYWTPPAEKNMLEGGNLPSACTHFEKIDSYIGTSKKLEEMVEGGKRYLGIWFGQGNNVVYFFSRLDPNKFADLFKAQFTAGTPIKIYYPLKNPVVSTENSISISGDSSSISFKLLPPAGFTAEYYADISAVIRNIESKLAL